jgi:hypothetical protein
LLLILYIRSLKSLNQLKRARGCSLIQDADCESCVNDYVVAHNRFGCVNEADSATDAPEINIG